MLDKEYIHEQLIRRAELIRGDDGYYIFFPSHLGGGFSAYHLRLIAEIMDELDAPWTEIVNNAHTVWGEEENPVKEV